MKNKTRSADLSVFRVVRREEEERECCCPPQLLTPWLLGSLATWLLGLSRMNDFRDFFTFIDESQRSGIEAET
jgi:hypothetical protein